jgi:hypothetical protein
VESTGSGEYGRCVSLWHEPVLVGRKGGVAVPLKHVGRVGHSMRAHRPTEREAIGAAVRRAALEPISHPVSPRAPGQQAAGIRGENTRGGQVSQAGPARGLGARAWGGERVFGGPSSMGESQWRHLMMLRLSPSPMISEDRSSHTPSQVKSMAALDEVEVVAVADDQ